MTNENMITCPHCRSEIPDGASVCRGCNAEIKYGTPLFFIIFGIVAPFFFAAWISKLLGIGAGILEWIVIVPLTLSGWFLFFKIGQKMYSGKARFIRYVRR